MVTRVKKSASLFSVARSVAARARVGVRVSAGAISKKRKASKTMKNGEKSGKLAKKRWIFLLHLIQKCQNAQKMAKNGGNGEKLPKAEGIRKDLAFLLYTEESSVKRIQ